MATATAPRGARGRRRRAARRGTRRARPSGTLAGRRRRSPVGRALGQLVAVMRLEASAMTRTRTPAVVSSQSAMSPLVAFVGFSTTVPVRATSLPRWPRRGRAEPRAIAAGKAPEPSPPVTASAAGRISSWPYGSASLPRISSTGAASGRRTPSGSFTTIPPLASAIANRAGVPRRPGSAVTTPRTVTVEPIGAARPSRASATVGSVVATRASGRGRRRRGRRASA